MKQADELAGLTFSRRRALGALLVLFASQGIPGLALADPAGKAGHTVANDLDAFIRLSAMVTGVSELDRNTARKVLALISAEPWGKEHLRQIAGKLMPEWSAQALPASRQELFEPSRFSDGERWFIGHLMTTWFTGVYYHQTGNHVVAYRDALMHVALQDVRPIPGHCDGTFGFWSEPPVGVGK